MRKLLLIPFTLIHFGITAQQVAVELEFSNYLYCGCEHELHVAASNMSCKDFTLKCTNASIEQKDSCTYIIKPGDALSVYIDVITSDGRVIEEKQFRVFRFPSADYDLLICGVGNGGRLKKDYLLVMPFVTMRHRHYIFQGVHFKIDSAKIAIYNDSLCIGRSSFTGNRIPDNIVDTVKSLKSGYYRIILYDIFTTLPCNQTTRMDNCFYILHIENGSGHEEDDKNEQTASGTAIDIGGTVTDSCGNPLRDATIFLQSEYGKEFTSITNYQGCFHIDNLPKSDEYRIEVAVEGYFGWQEKMIFNNDTSLTIELVKIPFVSTPLPMLSFTEGNGSVDTACHDQVLKFLSDFKLYYKRSNLVLNAFIDSSETEDARNQRIVTAFSFLVNQGIDPQIIRILKSKTPNFTGDYIYDCNQMDYRPKDVLTEQFINNVNNKEREKSLRNLNRIIQFGLEPK